jgi:thiol:disulfide interchange protein
MNKNVLIVAILLLGVGIFAAYQNNNIANDIQPIANNNTTNPELNNSQPPQPQPQPQLQPQVPMIPTSYEEALQIAQKQNKQVFLFFHASWCNWCEKMKDETLSDDEVKAALSKYVIYHVDTQKERNVASKYNVRGIPAYVITDKTGKPLKNGSGFKKTGGFINWLNGNDNRQQLNRRSPG